MQADEGRVVGGLLGLALGDAWGARYEGGLLERAVWFVIGRTLQGEWRWTDDTCMSLDVAEQLADKQELDEADLAKRFVRGYRWSRGYGRGTARVLRRISRGDSWEQASGSVFDGGSFGNGGAMRAPGVGLYFAGQRELARENAARSARITHSHPRAVEAAMLVAELVASAVVADGDADVATWLSRPAEPELARKFDVALAWLDDTELPSPSKVRSELGCGVAAIESCPTAMFIALRFLKDDFGSMLQYIRRCGGDTDTIGAMAGAIWGAYRGVDALPDSLLARVEARGRIEDLGRRLWTRSSPAPLD